MLLSWFWSKQNEAVAREHDSFPSAGERAPESSLNGICGDPFNIHCMGEMEISDVIMDEFKVSDGKEIVIQGFKK